MVYPEVTIAAPVRNRAWILPSYLEHLAAQDYPKDRIRLLFVLNDSDDSSELILREFQDKYQGAYVDIDIEKLDQKAPFDRRTRNDRDKIYHFLSKLRNHILSKIDTPYLLSVDTDILIPPYSISRLVATGKDIVAGVIWNDYIERPGMTYPKVRSNIMVKDNQGRIRHFLNYPLNSLFRVHTTGAFYLLSRKVCQELSYCYHPQGEDIGFCSEAEEKGFEVWVDSSIFGIHVMYLNQSICSDCVLSCKAPKVRDNIVLPNLSSCPKRKV